MDREIPKRDKRKAMIKSIARYGLIILGAVLLPIVVVNSLRSKLSLEYRIVAEVDRGAVQMTVSATGILVALNEEIIVSPISSRILEVYKYAGDSVVQGEAIMKLDISTVESAHNQNLDQMEMKKSRFEQLLISHQSKSAEMQMQLKVKQMKLKQLMTELKNERYLDSLNVGTQDKVKQAEVNFEVAQLERDLLVQQIENHVKTSASEVKVQQLEISQFEKSLDESLRLLADARILSPQSATLTYVNTQIGAQVAAGSQLAIVSRLDAFKVECTIADGYADRLLLGAKATIRAGREELTGTVVNIVPSVESGTIKFIVIFDNPTVAKLRRGLKADVHVLYGINDDTIRIPFGGFYTEPGVYDLWVISGDRAEKCSVTLGKAGFEHIEVLSGLTLGQRVIISDMSNYKDKKSIKISQP